MGLPRSIRSRANAAGALGNMVRNAGTLVTAMIRGGAVEALLHTVNHDSAPAPRRIALFSLGNFVGYSEVRDLLTAPQLEFESTMGAHHAVSSMRHGCCMPASVPDTFASSLLIL